MKINVAKMDIGSIFVLLHGWKGYNLNDKNIWIKETELNRKHNELFPYSITTTKNVIIKAFEACPLVENRMLILRTKWDVFIDAYLLVGDILENRKNILENYEFKTIELIDDSSHGWIKNVN